MAHDTSLAIRFGPLRYLLHAHDLRSRQELAAIRADVRCIAFDGEPDRVIHIVAAEQSPAFVDPISKGRLPDAVREPVTDSLPRDGWRLTWRESVWMAWHHPACRSALWACTDHGLDESAQYQLPWALLQTDIESRRGSLCHAALAVNDGSGFLFVAPPSGGKTTTASRLPADWTVLGDDTCLVWPAQDDREQQWMASPLPSWGTLLGKSPKLTRVTRWNVDESCALHGVLVLEKRSSASLADLGPIRAARALYLSLLEHPQINARADSAREYAFTTACRMARGLRAHTLRITKGADLDPVLREIA